MNLRHWSPPYASRLARWWQARLPATNTLTLTHRNVYILPSRSGWLFALTLLCLLIASINYQLSLGYVLTFLLAGSGFVSIHLTHQTLRGLSMHLRTSQTAWVGTAVRLDVGLHSSSASPRFGVGIRLRAMTQQPWTYVDLVPGGHSTVTLHWPLVERGWHTAPVIQLESRFPLGLFRAWAMWRPQARVLAYPCPETPSPALPLGRPSALESTLHHTLREGAEIQGVRPWRRGDSMHAIVWKKTAKALTSGGEWIVRDTRSSHVQPSLWLDWQDTVGLPTEQRLSRLTAWILQAERSDRPWGLRLPSLELPASSGPVHSQQALQHLALWPRL